MAPKRGETAEEKQRRLLNKSVEIGEKARLVRVTACLKARLDLVAQVEKHLITTVALPTVGTTSDLAGPPSKPETDE